MKNPVLNSRVVFWKQLRTNFSDIGSVIPSSKSLSRVSVACLAQKSGSIRVLEAGAGTGAFTQEILPYLGPNDSLDVVEINPEMMTFLKQRIKRDVAEHSIQAQIRFINADLLEFPLENQYDFIIFSLPLTIFPAHRVEELLDRMMAHLKPGGMFSFIKYVFIGQVRYVLGKPSTKYEMSTCRSVIRNFSRKYQVERRVVWTNVPPTWVHYWQKPSPISK